MSNSLRWGQAPEPARLPARDHARIALMNRNDDVAPEEELRATAAAMVSVGKGILAIDETSPTCTKRFTQAGIASTEETRRAYREMLVTTPGASEYISAAILFDETIRQKTSDGRPFADTLTAEGIIPGIKVDTGAKPLAKAPGETVTEGLDGLRERLNEYSEMGARFTKWRAVIRIGQGLPSRYCIQTNAHALGRYASLAQEAGLVPIVEPEVLMDGDHDIQRSQDVTEEVLVAVFEELSTQRCMLEGIILKPNMVTAGSDSGTQANANEVAERTLADSPSLRPREPCPVSLFFREGKAGKQRAPTLMPWPHVGLCHGNSAFRSGGRFSIRRSKYGLAKQPTFQRRNGPFCTEREMSSLASVGKYSEHAERALA